MEARGDLYNSLRRLRRHIGDFLSAVEREREPTGTSIVQDYLETALHECQTAVTRLHQLILPKRDIEQDLVTVRGQIEQAEARQAETQRGSTQLLIDNFRARERRLQEQQADIVACWQGIDDCARQMLSFMKDAINLQAANATSEGKEPYDTSDLRPHAKPVNLDSSHMERIKQDWEEAKDHLAASTIEYDSYINEREHGLHKKKWGELVAGRKKRKANAVEFHDMWFRESWEKYLELQEDERVFDKARKEAMAAGLLPRTIVYMALDKQYRYPAKVHQDLGEFDEHAEDGNTESFSPREIQVTSSNAQKDKAIIGSWWRDIRWSPVDAVSAPPSDRSTDVAAYPHWDAPSVGLGDSRSILDNGEGDGYNSIKRRKINEYKASCEDMRRQFNLVDGQTRYVPS